MIKKNVDTTSKGAAMLAYSAHNQYNSFEHVFYFRIEFGDDNIPLFSESRDSEIADLIRMCYNHWYRSFQYDSE